MAEFKGFWSAYRFWLVAAPWIVAIAFHVVRQGVRSLGNLLDTLFIGVCGFALSLLGTYVIARRKGAETLDARQRAEIERLEGENKTLQTKPYDAAIMAHTGDLFRRIAQEERDLLKFLLIHGESVEGEIPSHGTEERKRHLASCSAAGFVKKRTVQIPGWALYEYWRIAEHFEAPLRDLMFPRDP